MNLQNFIQNFASLFEETDSNLITAETNFKQLDEWSSLMALSTIAMIDEEYNIQIKGDDIRNACTVADLFNVVESMK